jgi:hypothetical protein
MDKKLVSKLLCLMVISTGLGFSAYLPSNQVSAASAKFCLKDSDCGAEAICWNRKCFYLKRGK